MTEARSLTGPLPPPPVPAECDLRGNEWFPLYHNRLMGSVWWRTASHMARACNIDMWMAAYRQVPAGSLADDDRELALAAGFHRDLDGFRAAKAELLETWTLCADGRWYQPTLAEICLDAWERMDERRRQDRERQAKRRARARGETVDVTRDTPVSHGGVTPEIALQDKTGQDTTNTVVSDEPKPGPAKAVKEGWLTDEPFCTAWDACTKQMRLRSKARDKTWEAWRRAVARAGPERLLAALRSYLRQDADVGRTGGPGFHKWLADGTWEHWLAVEPPPDAPPPDPLEPWRRRVHEFRFNGYWPGDAGPRPGKAGCRCPAEVLEEPTPFPTMANPKETQP